MSRQEFVFQEFVLAPPKVFRKKSKVKTWFNGLARETLAEDRLSESELSVATGNTVATFQGYPSLHSDDSGSEVEMEGPSNQAPDNMSAMRDQLQQLLAKCEMIPNDVLKRLHRGESLVRDSIVET